MTMVNACDVCGGGLVASVQEGKKLYRCNSCGKAFEGTPPRVSTKVSRPFTRPKNPYAK